ncbi:MAG: UDP-N-acetylmuramate--L-alanine ligase [Proteobacteria bacterium]|nr:UDP-N-acetylmuramate--L-alanine ligase [Pseudomonadota bacterium]
MRHLPLDIGCIHFVGIGGIGMSGIAEVMHNLGYQVQGSDLSENANVERLRGLGISVALGHKPDHLGGAKVVVVSSAVTDENPEIRAARARLIPVVRRAEMLAELMRLRWSIAVAGTHGKTTTTSMIAAVLDAASYDPTVINGGIINAYGTNARLGAGEWMVVEADESDGTFVKLPATIAVVTNIDPEHLDHYQGFDREREAFQMFVENIPFYGFAALCIDHPEVQAMIGRISDRRLITYGLGPQADVRGVDVSISASGASFAVQFNDRVRSKSRRFENLHIPMPGQHNVLNALAAVAVADEMGIGEDRIRQGFANFAGVKRRFTRVGTAAGITVIDDYAHHPVEIAAVLGAARAAYDGRIVAVVQPHRFSRLRDLFEEFCTCFNDADAVVVSEVYPAGEAPISGINRDTLVDGLRRHGHRHVVALPSHEHLAATTCDLAGNGDLVVCMGAGSITSWAQALPSEIEFLTDSGASAESIAGGQAGAGASS